MPRRLGLLISATLLGGSLAGCAYFPTPPDPIRLIDSPAEVSGCTRLGPVSGAVPTHGTGPVVISSLTVAAPATNVSGPVAVPNTAPGPGFVYELNAMRDRALALGATDLLLRRVKRDWSYVEGVAYRCRH
jgi:hypothetical protein